MKTADEDMNEILDKIKNEPRLVGSQEATSFVVMSGGFVMLGERLDKIIELMKPESIAEWAERTNGVELTSAAPKLSRMERAAAELGMSGPDLSHALRCAWNDDHMSDQNYANATEVAVDPGDGDGFITSEFP